MLWYHLVTPDTTTCMQSELEAAGERAREMSVRLAQLEEQEAAQRGMAQRAQQDAARLQGEVKSLAEVLAQRDADLQVNPAGLKAVSAQH